MNRDKARKAMRAPVMSLVLVALCVAAPLAVPAAGADTATTRYVLPVGVDTVVGTSPPVGVDLCEVQCILGGEANTVGNPIFWMKGPAEDFTVRLFDDVWGQNAAAGMCLSLVEDGNCSPGDIWLGIHCGPFYFPGHIGSIQIVVVGFTHRQVGGETCGATKGYAEMSWS